MFNRRPIRENKRLVLPPVEVPHSLRDSRFHVGYDFMHVGWGALTISFSNLESLMKEPDELTRSLSKAVELNRQITTGTYPNIDQLFESYPPNDYWITPGISHPTEFSPWERETDSQYYLTLTRRNLPNNYRQDAVSHYIRMDEHERLLNEAKQIVKFQPPVMGTEGLGDGFVYLIRGRDGLYKIGKTGDPKQRLKTHKSEQGEYFEFITLITSKRMHGLERDFHRKFANKRIHGEWFALTPEDIEYIKSYTEA